MRSSAPGNADSGAHEPLTVPTGTLSDLTREEAQAIEGRLVEITEEAWRLLIVMHDRKGWGAPCSPSTACAAPRMSCLPVSI
jgi:hypothetical protein